MNRNEKRDLIKTAKELRDTCDDDYFACVCDIIDAIQKCEPKKRILNITKTRLMKILKD